jgi:hypothetical protein
MLDLFGAANHTSEFPTTDSAGQRRSGRKRIEPIKYWEGEVLKVTIDHTADEPEKMIKTFVTKYSAAVDGMWRVRLRPRHASTLLLHPCVGCAHFRNMPWIVCEEMAILWAMPIQTGSAQRRPSPSRPHRSTSSQRYASVAYVGIRTHAAGRCGGLGSTANDCPLRNGLTPGPTPPITCDLRVITDQFTANPTQSRGRSKSPGPSASADSHAHVHAREKHPWTGRRMRPPAGEKEGNGV